MEAETFAVLMPLAVVLMPAGLALFHAAAAGLAALVWRPGASRVVALALALSAAEWLRGHILTGFPWNVLGYALTYPIELMQSAAVLGIYALTLAAVLIFALPAILWTEATDRRRGRLAAAAVALLPLAVAGALGWARLAYATSDMVPGVKIRIVQASIPQQERMRPELWAGHFREHLDLSGRDPAGKADSLAGVTHLIWPEVAMPFAALDSPEALSAVGDLLPEGTVLISGAIRVERGGADGKGPRRFFNSLLVLGRGGFLVALYDKIYLVPFGEFLPLRPLLAALGLKELAARGGYSRRRLAAAAAGAPRPAGRRAADLLRGHLPRRGGARPATAARSGRASSLTSPTTGGSATRRGRASTCIRRGCGQWRKGCRCCARPTTASRLPSMPTAGRWDSSI